MQFPKLAALTLILALAACGTEGQHWHGTLEQNGKTVEYETYYHPPGVGEKVFGGSTGLSYRFTVDGKTVDFAGNHIPAEWKQDQDNFLNYSPEFWDGVAEQFSALKPGKDHEEEFIWLRNTLNRYRESTREAAAMARP